MFASKIEHIYLYFKHERFVDYSTETNPLLIYFEFQFFFHGDSKNF